MSVYLDRARELRASVDPHYNCAQSVLVPFAERAGMSCAQACAVAQGFGGGMQTGSVCGACTGAIMALGVLGLADHGTVVELTERLRTNHGNTILCGEVLSANAEAGGEKKAFCDAIIYEAIALVEEYQAKAAQ